MKKNVKIKNKNNEIISNKNRYEDPTEFIKLNEDNRIWGKPKRWVRAKELTFAINGEQTFYYPDEEYDDADVLTTKIENEINYVELKAEYTIEIEDYNPVPTSVSPMQIRLALNQLGLRQIIEDAVASGSQDLKDMWEFATEFKRDYPLIIQLGIDLEITPEEIDNIFRLAGTK